MSDTPNVIDARQWILEHVERLLESDDGEAIPYLERLLVSSQEPQLRLFCLKNLGLLHLANGQLEESEKYLRGASEVAPSDPMLRHALGEVAAATGNWWSALLEFMQAVYLGRDHDDVVKFMRSVAATMRQLEMGEIALSVLVGAHERKPDDPWVLESIARMHEAEDRWLDAIEARDSLLEAIDAHRRLDGEEQGRLPEATLQRLESLSDRVRDEFEVVGENFAHRGPSDVARRHNPSGLHTLIEALGLRTNNRPLLEAAEALWARALDAKFDVHLSVPTLAAAIHWIVERMHWRVPTMLSDLARLYDADAERLPAAVRLLVACLEVELVPTREAQGALPAAELTRLQTLQRAILYDVDLDEVEPRGMLGGDDD